MFCFCQRQLKEEKMDEGGNIHLSQKACELSLAVNQLAGHYRRLELSVRSLPTQEDLLENNQRLQRDLSKTTREAVAASQKLSASASEADHSYIRETLELHNRAVSDRISQVVATLAEFRSKDLAALREKNNALELDNALRAEEIALLKARMQSMSQLNSANLHWARKKELQRCSTTVVHALSLRPAWRIWQTLAQRTKVQEVRKRIVSKRINACRTQALRWGLEHWHRRAGEKAKASGQKKGAASSVATSLMRYARRGCRLAFWRWRDFVVLSEHRKHRGRFQSLMGQTTRLEAKVEMMAHELHCLCEQDFEEFRAALVGQKEDTHHFVSEASRTLQQELTAHAGELDKTVSALYEVELPATRELIIAVVSRCSTTATELAGRVTVLADRMDAGDARNIALRASLADVETTSEFLRGQCEDLSNRQSSSESALVGTRENLASLKDNVASTQLEVFNFRDGARSDLETAIQSTQSDASASKRALQEALDLMCADIRDLALELRDRIAKRPCLRTMATLCNAYEDLCFFRNFNVPFPDDFLPQVAAFATEAARYVAEAANLEGLELVFAGPQPEEQYFDAGSRRTALLEELRQDLVEAANTLQPKPGAPRASAREKFIVRLMEAIDVALSKYDAVVTTIARTCFGRIKALPTCVACDRPLPTRVPKVVGGGGERMPEISAESSRKHKGDTQGVPTTPKQDPPLDVDLRRLLVTPAAAAATRKKKPPSVLRGGFRMPRVENTTAHPPSSK